MGGAGIQTQKGGRKSLDAAINLVPFIDLLSCCLSFLLITAVWSQLASVPVTHGQTGNVSDGRVPEDAVSFVLQLDGGGFVLSSSTGERTVIERQNGQLDLLRLGTEMAAQKRLHPTRSDITLRGADGVVYDDLIRTIDTLRAASFPDVHVTELRTGG